MKSINPYTLETIQEYPENTDSEISQKLELARDSFEKYRWTSFEERSKKMRGIAQNLRDNKSEFARTMSREMGKPLKEALSEVEKCAWVCEYYAENAQKFLDADPVETDADKSYVSYEPLGTILAVMPWNFPFWQVFRFAAPTVMAGNTALLKHASNVQGCARHIEKLFTDAGFEEGVFQNLAIHSNKVEQVLQNPIVKAASVTGSVGAGAAVAKICGSEVKPTVLELGGSCGFIVLKDADIDAAAKLGVNARMLNTGQSCIAAKRFIIEKNIAEGFISRFCEELSEMKPGNPLNEDTEVGPLARVDLAEDLEAQLQRSLENGAELVMGGKRDGAYFEPCVIKNVKPGMPAFDEEMFGPVAAMIVAENEEEAIELNNQSQYGLGASIVTKDTEKAEKLGRKIEDGAVFINELVKSDPRMPFGGTKKSGYGRELGALGIHEFVNAKTVHVKS